MTSQTATDFRRGRLSLAGDAAHRFPPTGGFGLNSGVQDAHNLAWKIAAIVKATAKESFLDTYEAERRPVIARFAEQLPPRRDHRLPRYHQPGLVPSHDGARACAAVLAARPCHSLCL